VKPDWMDGGMQEKKKATQIKGIVKQTIKRRSRSLSVADYSRENLPSSLSTSWSSIKENCLPGTPLCSPLNGAAPLDQAQGDNVWPSWDEEIVGSPNPLSTGTSPRSHVQANEVSSNSQARAVPATHRFGIEFQHSDSLKGFWAVPQTLFSESGSNPQQSTPTTPIALDPRTQVLSFETFGHAATLGNGLLSTPPDSETCSSGFSARHGQMATTDFRSPRRCLTSYGKNTSEEAALLMHYLDQVFYFQFPLYTSDSDCGGRGWLLALLTEDDSIHYATLALSQQHQRAKNGGTSIAILESSSPIRRDDYYVFALRQLQLTLEGAYAWNGFTKLTRCIQCLASILQLVFWDVSLLMKSHHSLPQSR
jgi:hypothetical protein